MYRFIQWFLAVIINLSFCYANNDFFSNPEMISLEDLLLQLESKSLDMCWQFGKNDFFHFISKQDEVYFEIQVENIPSCYDETTKKRFIEDKAYVFSYEWKSNAQPILNHPREHKILDANTDAYLVHERRIFEQPNPQLIDEAKILSIISNYNTLFYTGAGLSVASKIPSMKELYHLLELKEGNEFIYSLENALKDPGKFAQNIHVFHKACFFSPTTDAHKALAKLALFKNTKVVTENLDCLHEYSGILPYRINPEDFKQLGSSLATRIDYIICIGLSYDDRGFLGWYKKHHPKGNIISIDLMTPSYLGDEDFILHADLQQLFPYLADQI